MGDRSYRTEMWARRYEDPVGSLNELVDELAAEHPDRALPYVGPEYGGTAAEVLLLLSDPGPRAASERSGSGFVSCQNDDAGSARICALAGEAGLDLRRAVAWNAYPWYVNRTPGAKQQDEGVEPLRRLIDLLPALRVVVLMGPTAQSMWSARFCAKHASVAERFERLQTVPPANRDPSRGGRPPADVDDGQILATFRKAVALIGAPAAR